MDIKSWLTRLSFSKPASVHAVSFTPSVVFAVLAVAVIVLDVWMVQSALRLIYQYSHADVGARTVQSTRVNFDAYNKATERIFNAVSYEPQSNVGGNPFAQVSRAQQ